MSLAMLVPPVVAGREVRDRLEVLTALIDGPAFDPMVGPDVIQIPRDHPVFRRNCLVDGCEGQIYARELCRAHAERRTVAAASGPRGVLGVPGRRPSPAPAPQPVPDHVARALADQTNLLRLAGADTTDRGLRDI